MSYNGYVTEYVKEPKTFSEFIKIDENIRKNGCEYFDKKDRKFITLKAEDIPEDAVHLIITTTVEMLCQYSHGCEYSFSHGLYPENVSRPIHYFLKSDTEPIRQEIMETKFVQSTKTWCTKSTCKHREVSDDILIDNESSLKIYKLIIPVLLKNS